MGITDYLSLAPTDPFALLEIRALSTAAYGAAIPNAAIPTMISPGGCQLVGSPASVLAAYRFPLAPTDLRTDLEPAVAITWTQGGAVREHAGDRLRRLLFAGEVGLVARLGTDATGALRFLPSRELFEELRRFLERYLRLAARSPLEPTVPGSTVELVLRYFDRGLHYVVEPQRFSVIQDPQHRQTFRYELELHAVAEADAPPPLGGVLGSLLAGGSALLGYANAVAEQVALVAAIAQSWTGALASLALAVEQPLRTLQAAAVVLQQASTDLATLRRVPSDYIVGLVRLADQLRQGLDALAESITSRVDAFEAASWQDRFVQASTGFYLSVDDLRDQAAALAAGLAQLPNSPGDTTVTTGVRPYQTHLVVAGEDLPGIARRRLGDEGRADEIGELNDLRPPWISTSGLPGTARPGTLLLLPADAGPGTGDASVSAAPGSDEALYGVDLWLADGDLVAAATGDDLELRRGLDNVADALGRRIATPLGSNQLFPLLGVPDLVGGPSTRSGAWLLAHMVEQLRRDDRVRQVLSPLMTDLGDGAAVELTAQLVDGRQVPVAGSQ